MKNRYVKIKPTHANFYTVQTSSAELSDGILLHVSQLAPLDKGRIAWDVPRIQIVSRRADEDRARTTHEMRRVNPDAPFPPDFGVESADGFRSRDTYKRVKLLRAAQEKFIESLGNDFYSIQIGD